MQIIENKALVFRTRDPDKYSIIPRSKVAVSYTHLTLPTIYSV